MYEEHSLTVWTKLIKTQEVETKFAFIRLANVYQTKLVNSLHLGLESDSIKQLIIYLRSSFYFTKPILHIMNNMSTGAKQLTLKSIQMGSTDSL